jgi:hypothetical protein
MIGNEFAKVVGKEEDERGEKQHQAQYYYYVDFAQPSKSTVCSGVLFVHPWQFPNV